MRQCINRNDLAKVTKTKKKKKTHQNIKANIIINIRINKKNPKIINRRTHKAKKLNKMKKKEKVKLRKEEKAILVKNLLVKISNHNNNSNHNQMIKNQTKAIRVEKIVVIITKKKRRKKYKKLSQTKQKMAKIYRLALAQKPSYFLPSAHV